MGGMAVGDLKKILEDHVAPWVQDLDLNVTSANQSTVTLTMQPGERLNRTGGIVSGQALMAAADTAMVLAVNSANGEFVPCSTIDMTSSFLKPATNVTLNIVATVIRKGRTIAFTRVEISSSADDKAVLSATGTYALPAGR